MSSVLIVMDQRSSQGSLPSFLEGRWGGGGEGTLGTRLATDTLYLHLCSAGTTASIELFSDRGGLVKNVEEKAEKKSKVDHDILFHFVSFTCIKCPLKEIQKPV